MNLDIKGYLKLLSKYFKKHRKLVIYLFLISLASIVLTFLKPKLISIFVDEVKSSTPVTTLIIIGFIYLGVELLNSGVAIYLQYITENLGWSTTNDLRIDLVKHLIDLDMSTHKKYSAGQLIERIDGDISNLFIFFTTFVTGILFNFVTILGGMVYLLFLSPIFFLAQLVCLIIFLIYMALIRNSVITANYDQQEYHSQFFGNVSEALTSVEEVRAFRIQTWIKNKNRLVIRKVNKSFGKVMFFEFLSWSFLELLTISTRIVILVVASYLMFIGKMTLGEVFAIFMVTNLINSPISMLRNELQYMQSAESSIKRISELLDIKREVISSSEVFPSEAKIEFKNVFFAYEDEVDRNVINNVNFLIEDGEKVGILGRTGSGKTTLARLVAFLHNVTNGEILIGGKNINQISEEELRKNIAYLTQDVQFFSASIRDNLSLFRKDITDEMIMEVIEKTETLDWYKKLPNGLDTVLSDDVSFLSSGELQLMTVLRIFLKDPKIIILDEATAKLDPITEKYMQNAMNLLMKDRTTIIIAHRLSTVLETDKILILEKGSVIESGYTSTLLKDEKSELSSLLKSGIKEVLK